MNLNTLKAKGFKLTENARLKCLYKVWKSTYKNDIWDVYFSPSMDKIMASYDVVNFLEENGVPYSTIKIITHNTFHFSIGATIVIDEGYYFIYITKNNKYIYPIIKNIKGE